MKEKEQKADLDTRFINARNALSVEVVKKYQGMLGPFERIVSNEFDGDGGVQAIVILSNGTWDLKTGMDSTEIGKNPPAGELIEIYAGIRDKEYSSTIREAIKEGVFFEEESPKEKRYLNNHRKRLLGGLVKEMESKLRELNMS